MDEQIEIWKNINGYNGKYQISNLGRIRDTNYRNTNKIKIRKIQINNWGYQYVRITENGKIIHYFIHRLVYETFIGKIPENMQVNHIDENKTNNSISNLNLLCPKDNSNYGTRNKRISETKKHRVYNIKRNRDSLGRFV